MYHPLQVLLFHLLKLFAPWFVAGTGAALERQEINDAQAPGPMSLFEAWIQWRAVVWGSQGQGLLSK